MQEKVLNLLSLGLFRAVGGLLLWFWKLIEGIGARVIFFFEILVRVVRSPFEVREFIFQLYQVGVRSVGIVMVSGFFVGAIVAFQFYCALKLFGAQVYLGGITTSGLLREVGPVLVAIMITGRIGAYIAAELGTMKVSEQFDAIRVLGLDPIQVLVVPRFLSVVIMIFFLTLFGLLVSLSGGAFLSRLLFGVDLSYYLVNLKKLTTAWALFIGMIKSFLFGGIVATISCFQGFYAEGGAEGVGKAVNATLVENSIVIFLADYLVASIASLTFSLAESIVFLGV